MKPRVLIWICCRNYETYLQYSWSSAKIQTYPCTVKLSHDDCGGDDPVGVARNRNRVLWLAENPADYVIFLDADDAIPPAYVESLVDVAHGDSCVVTCNAQCFGDSDRIISVKRPVTLESILQENTVHASCLISLKAFTEAGGFDESLPAFEDWDLWCRLLRVGVEFRHCDKTHLFYRQHDGSRNQQAAGNFRNMRWWLGEKYGGNQLCAGDAGSEGEK